MKTTIQIKTIWGKLLFEFEKENNSIKDTLIEAVSKKIYLQGAYLQGAHLQGADLQGAYLQGAYLQGAELQGAHLQRAELQGAHLQRAELQGAHLQGAHLQRAELQGAHLQGAHLQGAHLQGAELQGAYLQGAELQGAELQGAHLQGAHLQRAELQGANFQCAELQGADLKKIAQMNSIVAEGELIVWKKLKDNLIAKLLIPAKAKRVNAIGSRKCRFEFADVLAIYDGKKKVKKGFSKQYPDFIYEVGKRVIPDSFDDSPLIECSNGIHAFITKIEAQEY